MYVRYDPFTKNAQINITMKTIQFNPNGGPLTAKAIFLGNIVADYEIFLREKNSNAQSSLLTGDNLNPEDDFVPLPTPALINDGRRVILETGFLGNDPKQDPNYEIRFEVFQDDQLLGFESDTGTLTGKGQFSLIFLRLS
jgi:hypothetical protein